MEILDKERYAEYEAFASKFACSFMQSANWAKVKKEWGHEIIVVRDDNGKIVGGMLVLIREIFPKVVLLYSPRGPVGDVHDRWLWGELLKGVKILATRYNAFLFKVDPPIHEDDEEFISMAYSFGFSHIPKQKEYDTIQRRYNYVLPLDKDEENLLMSFKSKCRYHIRVAQRSNVACEILGREGICDFVKLHEMTGKRKGFPTRSKEYYERLFDAFGENIKIMLCTYKGEVVSGCLLCTYQGKTSYIFAASSDRYKNAQPSSLMNWEAIKYAKSLGSEIYDFMAVPVDLDEKSPMWGVYQFKSGFNGFVQPYAGEFDLVFSNAKSNIFNLALKLKHIVNKLQLKASD